MAVIYGTRLPIANDHAFLPPLLIIMICFVGALSFCGLTRRNRYSETDDSPIMSPHTVSSLFPDRPIRPLPKRRLRERLSPEVADSIKYPPSTHDTAPLFYYPPYTLKDEGSPPSAESTGPVDQARRSEPGRNYTPRRNGIGASDTYEEETALRSTLVTRSPPEILARAGRRPSRADQSRHSNPQAPPSTTSSIDGYDSFENTNNKKKRKIPSAGDSNLNGTHVLNTEIGSLSISARGHSPGTELNGDRSYPHSAGYSGSASFMSSNQGISGPGRGRLGRSRNARSPLRALPDGSNTWAGRASKTAPPQWASAEHEGSGIISNAIANAEKLRPQGQENVSLLQQHSSAGKTTPASTQFTFTCDSQVPGTVQWPGHSSKHSTGTQTGSDLPSSMSGPNSARQDSSSKDASGASAKDRRPTRREVRKELRMAEKERRRLAEERLRANPPRKEDTWICQFCEYERIFGRPPAALIRQYEIKDRKLRQRLRQEEIDRKKLREKAKAKSRKAKRNGKLPAKEPTVDETPSQTQPEAVIDQGGPANGEINHQSPHTEEEGYEGEVGDDYSDQKRNLARIVEDTGGTSERLQPSGWLDALSSSLRAWILEPLSIPFADPDLDVVLLGYKLPTSSKRPLALSQPYCLVLDSHALYLLIAAGCAPHILPNMFGGSRRHRPPTQPLTRETANPNAATAAASAFMRREPSASLSSAAAAAALKARPTTPTNVAHVQSKRALRRSASASSTGSRERGRRELHRTPSNGSMTERTFRSPSPARSAVPNSHDVPPLPIITKHERVKSETTNNSHKRAASLQTQPFRTGSQKLQDGHESWFGGATTGDLSNVRHSDDVINSIPASDLRPSSPSSSINFSYPRSKLETPGSVAGSESTINDHTMVYDANSRRMVPRGQLLMREQRTRDASEKPVKKKKHSVSKSGSHLVKGNVSRIKGTAFETTPSETSQTSQVSSQASTLAKPQRIQEDLKPIPESEPHISSEQALVEEREPKIEPPRVDERKANSAAVVAPTGPPREAPLEQRQGHFQEVSESEDEEEMPIPENYRTTSPSRPTHAVDAVPVRPSSPVHAQVANKPLAAEQQTVPPPAPVEEESKPVGNRQQQSIIHTRVHSESPHRTTHFAPTTDSLLVRHEPPPRSLSPRKSAMKQACPRDASPSENGSELSSTGMSQGTQEDLVAARKKSARVSFDDQNTVVVGESTTPPETDSPVVPSPQTKKPWHSIIGRYKRNSGSLDEDETMTPRPALPSFGSVREKKSRETEERPLVRPVDRSWSPQATPTPPRTTSPSGTSAADIGQSSDLAIGSILAQEQASRNEANISKYREPLPPVVTSVESSGYISNSSTSSDDEMETDSSVQPEQTQEPVREEQATQNPSTIERKDFANPEPRLDDALPTISIIQPSPRPQDENQPDSPQDFFDVPGGFPDDTSDESKAPSVQGEDQEQTSTTLEQGRSTPETVTNRPAPITPQRSLESHITSPPSPGIHNIQEETEESEESSIYSDAYEDLSDIEGDGFMSLDAVVDGPVNTKFSTKMLEKAIAKSKERDASKDTTLTKPEFTEPLKTQDDWENAKAYWRSLSSDKRRQLEKEAMEEAGEEADLDEEFQEEKKKKSKKRRSLEQPKPKEPVPAEQPQDPTRVYQIQPGTTWGKDRAPPSLPKAQKATTSGKLRKSMRQDDPPARPQTDVVQPTSIRKSMRSSGAPASSSNEGHFRKTLRAEPEAAALPSTGMRKSLRSNGAANNGPGNRASLKKTARPASYQPAPSSQAVTNHRRHQSADPGVSPPTKPSLTRRGSDSSESSFRRTKSDRGQGFGFRSTMRGSVREPSAPVFDAGKTSSRFSLRSLSPTGSAFRRNSGTSPPPSMGMGMGGRMRSSLRPESSDGSTSRMRTPGFGRPTSKKAKKSKSSSRFADSSDEDDVRPSFRSRFAESSDEDDVAMPRPKGNGLPKSLRNTGSSSAAAATIAVPASRVEDEDSSELSDSDDEIVQPKRGAAPNGTSGFKNGSTLKRSGSGRESLAANQTQTAAQIEVPRPSHTRRGSFMSILRRKKDPAGKISRDIKESAARKDTRLERSTEQLAVIRSNSNSNANNARLQKRAPSWPLPEEHLDEDDEGTSHDTYVGDEKRPSTAGGPASAAPSSKPSFLKRRSTSHSAIGLNYEESAVGEGQKKKKFGALRKMFGLHD
ncbi:Fc.00g037000.m01.CDS01 [Cosmosporella sp. VM-42]